MKKCEFKVKNGQVVSCWEIGARRVGFKDEDKWET